MLKEDTQCGSGVFKNPPQAGEVVLQACRPEFGFPRTWHAGVHLSSNNSETGGRHRWTSALGTLTDEWRLKKRRKAPEKRPHSCPLTSALITCMQTLVPTKTSATPPKPSTPGKQSSRHSINQTKPFCQDCFFCLCLLTGRVAVWTREDSTLQALSDLLSSSQRMWDID